MPNLVSLALRVLEIWRGSQNLKSRYRDPGHTPFDPILHSCLVPLRIVLRAKFGVSSLSVMEIWRGPKI